MSLNKCGFVGIVSSVIFMSRISIDVTVEEHKRLKAVSALRGQSIKDYVIERTLGSESGIESALKELENILDERSEQAKGGAISQRTVSEIFEAVGVKRGRK